MNYSSRNGMLAVCKKKFAIRYLASITRARGLLFYRLLEQAVQTDLHKPNEKGVDTPLTEYDNLKNN